MFQNLIVLIYHYKSSKNSMEEFYLSIRVALPWHETGASEKKVQAISYVYLQLFFFFEQGIH